jgi:hypothetical protein
MQYGGRRDFLPLQTPNKAAASAKAGDIYLSSSSAVRPFIAAP